MLPPSPQGEAGEELVPQSHTFQHLPLKSPDLCCATTPSGLVRARCCCRSWFMSLVGLVMVNRVYDFPGNSYPWLTRELGWTGADLAAQYAIWHAFSFFALFGAGVALDSVGGVPVLGIGAALLLFGTLLLFAGHTPASLIPVRIITAMGYSSVELAANYIMADVFGKRLGSLSGCCRGRTCRCCGSGSNDGSDGSVANESGCVDDFPQIAFAMTVVQFSQRASMIPGLLMAPVFMTAFGWYGVGYILIFGSIAFFSALAVISIYRGWLPCCALSAWDAPLPAKLADSEDAPLLKSNRGGDVVAAALNGAEDMAPQTSFAPLKPPGVEVTADDETVAVISPAPELPLTQPQPQGSTCKVPERFNFCQPELRSGVVLLNAFVGAFGQVFYLPFAEFAGLFFVETYNMSDSSANLLVVWVKLSVLLALLPVALLLDLRWLNFHAALIAGAVFVATAWLLFAFSAPLPPAFASVLAGIGFATIAASSTPMLALRCRPSVRGRMFGLYLALLHVLMISNALIIGALRDRPIAPPPQVVHTLSSSRSLSSVFYLAAGEVLTVVLAVALAIVDKCREPVSHYSDDDHDDTKKA